MARGRLPWAVYRCDRKDVGLGFGTLQLDSCSCLTVHYMYSGEYFDLSELHRWADERFGLHQSFSPVHN